MSSLLFRPPGLGVSMRNSTEISVSLRLSLMVRRERSTGHTLRSAKKWLI